MRRQGYQVAGIFVCVVWLIGTSTATAQEWKSGVEWQEPPVVTVGASNADPPSDAVVLFDGHSLDAWVNGDRWLVEDGVAIPRETGIQSKQLFGDMQLHVEWSAPADVRGSGQGRGNSGVYLMGVYEIQVLDSYDNPTYFDGQAGAVYKQTPPMVNAMRKPGEWNTYDILFTAPRFRTNGDLKQPAYVTLIHNGVVVLNHFELLGPTSYTQAPHYEPHARTGPITLQFHGDPVRFRNIWVRELHPPQGVRVRAPYVIRPEPAPEPAPESKSPEDEAPAETQESGAAETDDPPESDDEPDGDTDSGATGSAVSQARRDAA